MQSSSVLGLMLGLAAVLVGALLEGLTLHSMVQPTAAIIVFGGTLGAVLVSFPFNEVQQAWQSLGLVFAKPNQSVAASIEEMIQVAQIARKEGILAIEPYRDQIKNLQFKKSIKYVIDGFEPHMVKEILEGEIQLKLDHDLALAKVWESAGGYAPTVGIIGAVLGLIHVLGNLSDPSKLGEGIAVAFVATIYGVAAANLVFIPFATKLKRVAELNILPQEIVKMGVLGIQEGLNPLFLKEKLEVFIVEKKTS